MIEHDPADSLSEDPEVREFAVHQLEQKQDEVLRRLEELDAQVLNLLDEFSDRSGGPETKPS